MISSVIVMQHFLVICCPCFAVSVDIELLSVYVVFIIVSPQSKLNSKQVLKVLRFAQFFFSFISSMESNRLPSIHLE